MHQRELSDYVRIGRVDGGGRFPRRNQIGADFYAGIRLSAPRPHGLITASRLAPKWIFTGANRTDNGFFAVTLLPLAYSELLFIHKIPSNIAL
jgi:hypothetical protein